MPRFKQDDDGLWTEIEDGRNRSSIFNMFGDEWLNKNSRTPDWIKTPIKIGINNTVPGISYAISNKPTQAVEKLTKKAAFSSGVNCSIAGVVVCQWPTNFSA